MHWLSDTRLLSALGAVCSLRPDSWANKEPDCDINHGKAISETTDAVGPDLLFFFFFRISYLFLSFVSSFLYLFRSFLSFFPLFIFFLTIRVFLFLFLFASSIRSFVSLFSFFFLSLKHWYWMAIWCQQELARFSRIVYVLLSWWLFLLSIPLLLLLVVWFVLHTRNKHLCSIIHFVIGVLRLWWWLFQWLIIIFSPAVE